MDTREGRNDPDMSEAELSKQLAEHRKPTRGIVKLRVEKKCPRCRHKSKHWHKVNNVCVTCATKAQSKVRWA